MGNPIEAVFMFCKHFGLILYLFSFLSYLFYIHFPLFLVNIRSYIFIYSGFRYPTHSIVVQIEYGADSHKFGRLDRVGDKAIFVGIPQEVHHGAEALHQQLANGHQHNVTISGQAQGKGLGQFGKEDQ